MLAASAVPGVQAFGLKDNKGPIRPTFAMKKSWREKLHLGKKDTLRGCKLPRAMRRQQEIAMKNARKHLPDRNSARSTGGYAGLVDNSAGKDDASQTALNSAQKKSRFGILHRRQHTALDAENSVLTANNMPKHHFDLGKHMHFKPSFGSRKRGIAFKQHFNNNAEANSGVPGGSESSLTAPMDHKHDVPTDNTNFLEMGGGQGVY